MGSWLEGLKSGFLSFDDNWFQHEYFPLDWGVETVLE
jgi:hypothetical protein